MAATGTPRFYVDSTSAGSDSGSNRNSLDSASSGESVDRVEYSASKLAEGLPVSVEGPKNDLDQQSASSSGDSSDSYGAKWDHENVAELTESAETSTEDTPRARNEKKEKTYHILCAFEEKVKYIQAIFSMLPAEKQLEMKQVDREWMNYREDIYSPACKFIRYFFVEHFLKEWDMKGTFNTPERFASVNYDLSRGEKVYEGLRTAIDTYRELEQNINTSSLKYNKKNYDEYYKNGLTGSGPVVLPPRELEPPFHSESSDSGKGPLALDMSMIF